jgi:hypothetical protein
LFATGKSTSPRLSARSNLRKCVLGWHPSKQPP